ncbi:HNH endonuclease family protein [Sphingomonas oryzagri]
MNTRAVGGTAIKQHYVVLLAGRHLPPDQFTRLCNGVEQVMSLWLFAGVLTKDYERAIIAAARTLRSVKTAEEFAAFERSFFDTEKRAYAQRFVAGLKILKTWDIRQFRMKYLLAKVAQYVDIEAYGTQGHEALSAYLLPSIDVEHILAQGANAAAKEEFGESADDGQLIQSLGNLMLLEKSVNIVASNEPYSIKCGVYPSSKFLLSRCQEKPLQVGVNDRITRAMKQLDPALQWDRAAIEQRQRWFAEIALDVWQIRIAAAESTISPAVSSLLVVES